MSRTINTMVKRPSYQEPDPKTGAMSNNNRGREQIFADIESKMTDYYLGIYKAIPQDKREQVLESLELLVQTIKGECCC